jgi:hypothetical protein
MRLLEDSLALIDAAAGYLPPVINGQWIFLGAGGAIGAVVALIVLLPLILPRLTAGRYRFSRDDEERLAATLPVYAALGKTERKRLHKRVRDFLGRVTFKSAAGNVPAILRVGIAGHACSLRLYGRRPAFPELRRVWLDGPARKNSRRCQVLIEREAQLAMGGEADNSIIRAFAARLYPRLSRRAYAPTGWLDRWFDQVNPAALAQQPPFDTLEQQTHQAAFLTACETYMQRTTDLEQRHPALFALLQELLIVDPAHPPEKELKDAY